MPVTLEPHEERRGSIYALSNSSSYSNLAETFNLHTEILPNKPHEPTFKLGLEPIDGACFRIDQNHSEPAHIRIFLENNTDQRQTFKIKTTLTEKLRAKPPLGIIEPHSELSIRISYNAKEIPDGLHYIAIYHIKLTDQTDEELKDLREFWKKNPNFDGVRRIVLNFEIDFADE
uniref:Major sperm protein n=1 Tax=Bursaphelenchus xylophilus TaxID=6326 RepID=A0A1I7RUK9_BURXY